MASVSVTPMASFVCKNRQLDQPGVRISPFVPLRLSFVLTIIAHSVTNFADRRTFELTRRREFNQASPDESNYETRSRRSRPTICSTALSPTRNAMWFGIESAHFPFATHACLINGAVEFVNFAKAIRGRRHIRLDILETACPRSENIDRNGAGRQH